MRWDYTLAQCPHPIIVGLIREMPQIGAGWPEEERKRWLLAMESAVNLIYRDLSVGQSVGTYDGNTTFQPEKMNN